MTMTIKLAWRNIWRNRRRAIITMASVFFAVFFCAVMQSYEIGMWNQMISNTLQTQTGHIEIHGRGWWDDKVIDNFMTMSPATIDSLRRIPGVENVSPRVETFAMASVGSSSKGIAVIGISPEQEAIKSKLPRRLVKGQYLTEADDGILIAEGLSRYMKADVGDTIALIGQGYHGASAVGLFPIRGIVHFLTDDLNAGTAYITLPAAWQFIDMPNGFSGILIALYNEKDMNKVMPQVKHMLADRHEYEVLPWTFTMQRLLQASVSDRAFLDMILYILYVIVGFGILGTVIMLTNERKREFSVMISLGMQRLRLSGVVMLELLLMSTAGIVTGIAVSIPIAFYFEAHPIMITGQMADTFAQMGMEPSIPFSTDPLIFLQQGLIAWLLTALAMIYPIRKIHRMHAVNRN